MSCNVNTLLSNGASFQSLDSASLRIVQIALLKTWLLALSPAADVTPAAILARATDYQKLDTAGIRNCIFQSLCTISGG